MILCATITANRYNVRLELWPSRPGHDTLRVGLFGEISLHVISG